MKRIDASSLNRHNVIRHNCFFKWSNCMKCGLDFRRENGVSWLWFTHVRQYMCLDCSHNANIEWVNSYIDWLYEMERYKRPPTGR